MCGKMLEFGIDTGTEIEVEGLTPTECIKVFYRQGGSRPVCCKNFRVTDESPLSWTTFEVLADFDRPITVLDVRGTPECVTKSMFNTVTLDVGTTMRLLTTDSPSRPANSG